MIPNPSYAVYILFVLLYFDGFVLYIGHFGKLFYPYLYPLVYCYYFKKPCLMFYLASLASLASLANEGNISRIDIHSTFYNKKSCIQETKHLSTNADSITAASCICLLNKSEGSSWIYFSSICILSCISYLTDELLHLQIVYKGGCSCKALFHNLNSALSIP